MKKSFISDFVFDTIKDMDPLEVDNFIASLEHFASILKK
jgi:hypothetical protein